jgi:predicted nucleotidyltransferase
MVTLSASTQSLLAQLHEPLKTLYGNRLCQVVLFGSYARGGARPAREIAS